MYTLLCSCGSTLDVRSLMRAKRAALKHLRDTAQQRVKHEVTCKRWEVAFSARMNPPSVKPAQQRWATVKLDGEVFGFFLKRAGGYGIPRE